MRCPAKRLTLGLAVGARLDDYETAQVDHRGRGPRLSEQLAALRDGDDLGVRADLPLLVGGMVGPAFARMARYADGYAHNGGPPRAFARAAASALAAWSDLGRPGRPLLWGQGYFALGDEDRGRRVPARLLRLHRPVRGEDRRRQPHLRPRDPRLRARLRGGRLRRADPLPDGRRPRAARAPRRGAGVKVRIIGAGPAGLYLAILLKKADRHDVTVIERNAPDATFGWGVVFSEETLGALRDADPESHLQITDTFARWPAIDIHYRGRRCARAATRSRPSRASCSCRSSSGARASSASTCASRPR